MLRRGDPPAVDVHHPRATACRLLASRSQIDNVGQTWPGLRGCHILEGAGHWIQREPATAVNDRLLSFLQRL